MIDEKSFLDWQSNRGRYESLWADRARARANVEEAKTALEAVRQSEVGTNWERNQDLLRAQEALNNAYELFVLASDSVNTAMDGDGGIDIS
ncbi:hypothetical protein [Herbiconiux daphne]|uniref:Uncharacterized protein n=1 Tax=Herbiconiux daphne TaxID=2970914 RepID=A0ABT2H6F6_9MICO|nr:hypothetical protein [Herbiconiux daphne]MCS5735523.1 hypothetical protein [Herbiconiux daphne]